METQDGNTVQYKLIEENTDRGIFHHRIESLIDPAIVESINVFICAYSVTEPFYVEGMPSIDPNTNIYGRILPQYNIPYPCIQWVFIRENGILQFPQFKYEPSVSATAPLPLPLSLPLPLPLHKEEAKQTNNEDSENVNEDEDEEDRSQETIRFENEAHLSFLSMFTQNVSEPSTIEKSITSAYKGFLYEESTQSIFVFYDFSSIHELLETGDNRILCVPHEIRNGTSAGQFSPEVTRIFGKYPFLSKLRGYSSPKLMYMCNYDNVTKKYTTVDTHVPEDAIVFPVKHDLLGVTCYYFTETPLPSTSGDATPIRFVCIESRIMYEVRIDADGEIYYMGENVKEFKDDFELGVFMSSTIHYQENGVKIIAIKNPCHIHRI